MIKELSDNSVIYVIKILEGLRGLEIQNNDIISEKELQNRLSDIRMGMNCAEHELIEA